jgi:putative transposase
MTLWLIDRERAHHAVCLLCAVLGVTREGYWAWSNRPASPWRLADERIKPMLLQAWRESDET